MEIHKEIQRIVDSYDVFPIVSKASDSLVEEVADRIVDYVMLNGMTMDDFDFDKLFENVNLKKWK